MKVKISEIFSSIQGEGPNIGKPAIFVRFHGCNLNCSYCDSKYAKDEGDYIEYELDYLINKIGKLWNGVGIETIKPLIVFTGGEPLLYSKQIIKIMDSLTSKYTYPQFEIETNGTIKFDINKIDKSDLCTSLSDIYFNVSPKLSNSDIPEIKRLKDEVLISFLWTRTIYKFVVQNEKDIDEIANDFYFLPQENIVIMPEGVTAEIQIKRMRKMIDTCIKYGFRLIPRFHTLIWDNKRGV